jgi:hypothetical protein
VENNVCHSIRIEQPTIGGCALTMDTRSASAVGATVVDDVSCQASDQTVPVVSESSDLCTYLQALNLYNCTSRCESTVSPPACDACEVFCPTSGVHIDRSECPLAKLNALSVLFCHAMVPFAH